MGIRSSLALPAVLSEESVRLVSLLLPEGAEFELAGPGAVRLSFRGIASGELLFSWEIRRKGRADFSGTALPSLIQDLAGTAAARRRELAKEGAPLETLIEEVVRLPQAAAAGRHCADGGYEILPARIESRRRADWD